MPAKAAISLNLYGFVSQTYQITPIMGTVLGHKYVFQQMLTMIYDSHFLRVLWHSYNSFVLRACKSHFTHPQCQGKGIASVDQRERGLELAQKQHTGVWSRGEEHSLLSPPHHSGSPIPSHPGGQLSCSTSQCYPFQIGTKQQDRAWAPTYVHSRASAHGKPFFFLQQKLPEEFRKMDNNSPRRNLATMLV